MRFFAKIYSNQDIDAVSFECDPVTTTMRQVKRIVIGLTNLDEADTMKVIFRGVPLASDEVSLWDLSAKEDDTVHIVVEKMADPNKRFRILKDRQQFNVLRDVSDQALVTLFSFLDTRSMAACALVCRKWSYLSMQNQPLWRWNCSVEFARDSASANPITVVMSEEEPGETAAGTGGGDESSGLLIKGQHPFKDWLTTRMTQRAKWRRVAKFTLPEGFSRDRQTTVVFKKGREMRVRKQPKELTEEEKQFLKDNDPRQLKKLLRKKKGAREMLKRHRQLQKRQDELESGVWRYIPEAYVSFDFETLMRHSFGFLDKTKNQGYEFKYEFGRIFFTKDGQTVFLAEIEPDGDQLRFNRIVVEEGAPDLHKSEGDKQDIELFFNLLSQCSTANEHTKEFLKVIEGDHQSVIANAVVIPTVSWTDGRGALQVTDYDEEPDAGEVGVVLSPRSRKRRDNKLLWSIAVPLVDGEDDAAAEKNEDNIVQAYYNSLLAGLDNVAVDTIAICSIEGRVLRHEEDFASVKAQITDKQWDGALFARACKQFVDTKLLGLTGSGKKGSHSKTLSEADALLAPKQSTLLRAILVVADGEELTRARAHVTIELNKL